MIFLNSSVISKKIYNDSLLKTKAFFASLLIHSTLLATVFHFMSSNFVRVQDERQEAITISLSNYVPSSVVSEIAVKPKESTQKLKKKLPKKIPTSHKVLKQKMPTKQKQTLQKTQPKHVVSSEAFTPTTLSAESVTKDESMPAITNSKISPLANQNLSQDHTSQKKISNEALARIRSMIQNSLSYPAIARKLKKEGVVLISFSLSVSGHIDNLRLLESSGSSALDKRALQTVSLLDGEYPQLSKKVDLKIPISFSLQKS